MRHLRSTPLRLTVVVILVFAGFLGTGLGTAYLLMHRTLSVEIDSRATQLIAELRAIPDADERLERASQIAASADPRTLLVRLSLNGVVVGNLPRTDLRDGVVRGHDVAPGKALSPSYLVRSADLSPGHITVLIGRENLEELNEIFLAILACSVLPALLLTSAIGLVAVRRTGARVGAIQTTLQALTQGDLSARTGAPHPDTDLGDISRDLDRMAEAQEAATQALRQIGSDIAHDLKTPIQRVSVRLERLADTDLPPAARAQLEGAQAETAQIIATFQSLLQITQLEGGQGRDSFGPIDLVALLQDMAEIYEPAVDEHGGTLSCDVHEAQPITGDRHLLSRLIANLVENALRHAPGSPIRLSLSGRVLSISDTGPGIPEARRHDVLRRLVRLDASRSTPGSGLGLAMVKAIADLHGAQLSLGNAGPGLIVAVAFPDPQITKS
ncbi:sensor histidine kinase [Pseudooceanicola spongiae]|uniref:histidine kinase n=1 Tax=Pseudooceanicola spongiae TaxID=2613965 RepID=A0A7L9WK92_9RHOB|nr:HAMP domain-containing sensor histidine kinase [Pseudooceanicola spongiae]QOL80811.1 HAMP domain-containing protein [Pseudooceanicola spongiae]